MANSFFKNYFGFNRQQRNGLYVLILVSFVLLIIRLVYPVFIQPGDIVVENLPLTEKKQDSIPERDLPEQARHSVEAPGTERFNFDPNTVSLQELIKLGFTTKTAAILLKFRSKGFVFKKKEDLKKVYDVSDELYDRLEPYISIAKNSVNSQTVISGKGEAKIPEPVKPAVHIELNTTDSAGLESINGIGPAFAGRILKYRSLLGGYVAAEQLKEVYGFNNELYQKIKPFVSVNPLGIKKINPNKDDFKTINRHPYLSYELTKSIFGWRRKTNINPTNLKDIVGDDSLYQKLLPYLTFD